MDQQFRRIRIDGLGDGGAGLEGVRPVVDEGVAGGAWNLCRDRQISGYNNMFANTSAASQAITARGVANQRVLLHRARTGVRDQLFGDTA